MLEVVAEHDLRKYMKTSHEVTKASWDKERAVWEVEVRNLETKEEFTDTAEFFINNEGLLKQVTLYLFVLHLANLLKQLAMAQYRGSALFSGCSSPYCQF
jgi:glycerol-3-phosphate dehydrogenase